MKREQALKLFDQSLLRRGRAASTRHQYAQALRQFLKSVKKPIKSVTRVDVKRYLAALESIGVPANGQARMLSCLRVFFRFLVQEEHLAQSPIDGLSVRFPRSAKLVLSVETVSRLFAATEVSSTKGTKRRGLALRNRAALELLYGLGLRNGEARAARVVDLSLSEATLVVRQLKRGVPRVLPLPHASIPHLDQYLSEGRPLLLGERPDPGHLLLSKAGRPFQSAHMDRVVGGLGEKIGVHCYPHALRRAIATHLIQAGVSVPCVQLLLGHVSLSSTQVYLGLGRADLHRAVALLDRSTRTGSESIRGEE